MCAEFQRNKDTLFSRLEINCIQKHLQKFRGA